MKLTVDLTPPYPVIVEAGAYAKVAEVVGAAKVALISDATVAPLYARHVQEALEAAGRIVYPYTVAAGENSKSLPVLGTLLSQLARDGLNRQSAVVALGGGVVSDLAGFVAASYMRGVDLYILPTTLLAMVDAAVGGKTGVNLPEGKNLVGAFWQPKAVLMDVSVLKSLPHAAFRSGAVELFKHGLLADQTLLDSLGSADIASHSDPDFLADLIGRSVRVKADIIAADERESGKRAFLNLGHTLAHALEALTDHALSHGDAVTYGLLFAAELAAARGYADETARIVSFLRWVDPAPLPHTPLTPLLPYIARDKKHGVSQRWVLLKKIGQPVIADDVQETELRHAWARLQDTLRVHGLLRGSP